jgi:hypothetical protein
MKANNDFKKQLSWSRYPTYFKTIKVYCCVHKNPPLKPIVNYLNPILMFIHYKIRFNIILPHTRSFPSVLFNLNILILNYVSVYHIAFQCYMTCYLSILCLYNPKVQSMSFLTMQLSPLGLCIVILPVNHPTVQELTFSHWCCWRFMLCPVHWCVGYLTKLRRFNSFIFRNKQYITGKEDREVERTVLRMCSEIMDALCDQKIGRRARQAKLGERVTGARTD